MEFLFLTRKIRRLYRRMAIILQCWFFFPWNSEIVFVFYFFILFFLLSKSVWPSYRLKQGRIVKSQAFWSRQDPTRSDFLITQGHLKLQSAEPRIRDFGCCETSRDHVWCAHLFCPLQTWPLFRSKPMSSHRWTYTGSYLGQRSHASIGEAPPVTRTLIINYYGSSVLGAVP